MRLSLVSLVFAASTVAALTTGASAKTALTASRSPWAPWGAQSFTDSPRTLYRSGNECGPDRAVAQWGAGNAFLGYACEPESANGS